MSIALRRGRQPLTQLAHVNLELVFKDQEFAKAFDKQCHILVGKANAFSIEGFKKGELIVRKIRRLYELDSVASSVFVTLEEVGPAIKVLLAKGEHPNPVTNIMSFLSHYGSVYVRREG